MKELCIKMLEEKGVTIDHMIDILHEIQKDYVEDLDRDTCRTNILAVLEKREVQHTILTGVEIDRLADEGQFREPIQSIIARDEGRYGIDEIIALSIVFVYGSIGITNFGYLDKYKPGIIHVLNDKKRTTGCTTFTDDIVCAICAAAASRLAHSD